MFENKEQEKAYKKAQKEYKEGGISESELGEVDAPIRLSQAEIAYLYMQYRNQETHIAFKAKWGKDTARIR